MDNNSARQLAFQPTVVSVLATYKTNANAMALCIRRTRNADADADFVYSADSV